MENEIRTRKDFLDAADICINGKRPEQYGKPEDNFKNIANLWTAYLGDRYISSLDVPIMLALLKIGRIMGGGSIDSYVDFIGYGACAGEIYAKSQKEKK